MRILRRTALESARIFLKRNGEMREVDETLLILKKFRYLPRELWRKIVHQTLLNRPGSKFFSRNFFLRSDPGPTLDGGWFETPLAMWLGHFPQYWEEDNVVRYVSRHTFATRLQASIRGLLQRWRDLNESFKGVMRWGSMQLGFDDNLRRGDMQYRLHTTHTQLVRQERRFDRLRRRLRRQHGETVAAAVVDSQFRKRLNTIDRTQKWFDHRKRLGVKLLDFGS